MLNAQRSMFNEELKSKSQRIKQKHSLCGVLFLFLFFAFPLFSLSFLCAPSVPLCLHGSLFCADQRYLREPFVRGPLRLGQTGADAGLLAYFPSFARSP